jgi:hypothetical protein
VADRPSLDVTVTVMVTGKAPFEFLMMLNKLQVGSVGSVTVELALFGKLSLVSAIENW